MYSYEETYSIKLSISNSLQIEMIIKKSGLTEIDRTYNSSSSSLSKNTVHC